MFMIEARVNPANATTLIVGFSPAAATAAQTLLRRGQSRRSMFVVTNGKAQAAAAASLGLVSGTAGSFDAIGRHLGPALEKVIVDVEDDVVAGSVVRLARSGAPEAVILVRACDPAAVARLMASGASQAFCDATIAGSLLADTAAEPRRRTKVVLH